MVEAERWEEPREGLHPWWVALGPSLDAGTSICPRFAAKHIFVGIHVDVLNVISVQGLVVSVDIVELLLLQPMFEVLFLLSLPVQSFLCHVLAEELHNLVLLV